jgi:glycosyltransferase 2 family protein
MCVSSGSLPERSPVTTSLPWRPVLQIATRIFTPAALAFVLYVIWETREVLIDIVLAASLPYVGLSILIWCGLHLLAPRTAVAIIYAAGEHVPWTVAFKTHASRLPARYIPGGIWHTAGRVVDYRDYGVTSAALLVFVMLEHVLALATTTLAGGSILFLMRGSQGWGTIGLIGATVALVALVLGPFIINSRSQSDAPRVTTSGYLRSFGWTALFWVGASASFVAFASALPAAFTHVSWLELTGVYLFAWAAGFAAIFAPQGIGVFEAVTADLLNSPLTFQSAVALAAGFRVVILIADLIVWALATTFSRGGNSHPT